MGLLDSLFGSKKAETPASTPKPEVKVSVAMQPVAASTVATDELPPEIVAAICASIGLVMDDGGGAELAAAIAAVILHSKGGGCRAVSFKRTSNAWSANGRQKIMDGRQMF